MAASAGIFIVVLIIIDALFIFFVKWLNWKGRYDFIFYLPLPRKILKFKNPIRRKIRLGVFYFLK